MKKIKLICFDLNKTLIKENTWLDLNLAMGMTQIEDDTLMNWGGNGIVSYLESMKILEKIYKLNGKASIQNISNTISKYTYLPFAKELISDLKNKGYEIALISGAMDILVEKVASELDIKFYASNSIFVFDDKDYLDYIVTFDEDKFAKLSHLQGFCRQLGITLEECICIGDGDNDIEMFKKTKNGITFKGSKIEKEAWKIVENLEEIKSLF